jgi:hypothetical protein
MASSSLDTLREVVVRSSQTGRLRVDVALSRTERGHLLQSLGEKVLGLVQSGQLELPEDARSVFEQIRELDTRIQSDYGRIHDNAFGAPRGFEPEAYDDLEGDEEDEHAAQFGSTPRRESR